MVELRRVSKDEPKDIPVRFIEPMLSSGNLFYFGIREKASYVKFNRETKEYIFYGEES